MATSSSALLLGLAALGALGVLGRHELVGHLESGWQVLDKLHGELAFALGQRSHLRRLKID